MDEHRLRRAKRNFTSMVNLLDSDPAPSFMFCLAAVPSRDGGFQVQSCMMFDNGMTYGIVHELVDNALRLGFVKAVAN